MKSLLKLNRKTLLMAFSLLFILIFSSFAFAVHKIHVEDQKLRCELCHNTFSHDIETPPRTDFITTEVTPRFNYLNGFADIDNGQAGDTNDNGAVMGAYNRTTKECSNVDCHGEAFPPPTPPSIIDCKGCHFSTADVDDFTFTAMGQGTPVMAKIDSAQWASTGHGRLGSAYPSGNPAPLPGTTADFSSCTNFCHTKAVIHNTANNPFRLITAGGAIDFSDAGTPQLDNDVCLDCHDTNGVNTALASIKFDANTVGHDHFGSKHLNGINGPQAGGKFCWDCHDPHGDTANDDYMMQEKLTRKNDGLYGKPADKTLDMLAHAPFTKAVEAGENANTALDWSDFTRDVTFDGICQKCHATFAEAGAQANVRFTRDNYDATHNPTQPCNNCHVHPGFQADCSGCHNYPMPGGATDYIQNTATETRLRADSPPNQAVMTNTHLKHTRLVDVTCATCHGHNGSGATHNQGTPADKVSVAVNPNFVTIALDTALWNHKGASPLYNGNPLNSATLKTCDNITCHFGLSPDWAMRGGCNDTTTGVIEITNPANGTTVNGALVTVQVAEIVVGNTDLANAEYETSNNPGVWNSCATVPWDTSGLVDSQFYTVNARATDLDCGDVRTATATVQKVPAITWSPFTSNYTGNPGSGVNLGHNTTNMACAAALTTSNNFVVLESTESCLSLTRSSTTTTGSPLTFMTAVRNTTRADDLEITQFSASANFRDYGATAYLRPIFELIEYIPGGTDVVIGTATYGTSVPTGAYTQISVTNIPVTGSGPHGGALIHAGNKVGLRVKANVTATTEIRFSIATTTTGSRRMTLSISGWSTDGTGLAPRPEPASVTDEATAPPASTFNPDTPVACNTCHQFGPQDDGVSGSVTINVGGVDQYYYERTGDHDKHGMTNIKGNDPTGADTVNTCDVCHTACDPINDLGCDPASWTNGHFNSTVNFKPDGTLAGGKFDGSVARTCTNVSCHTGTSPVWGAVSTLTCFDANCHGGAESAIKPLISNGSPNKVNKTEYDTTGHGLPATSFYASGNPGAGLSNYGSAPGCYSCHANNLLTHMTKDPNDPFRLGGFAQNFNGLCMQAGCHDTYNTHSFAGIVAGGNTNAYASWQFAPKCTDCHDPHGDSNWMMIRTNVFAATDTVNPGGGSYNAEVDGSGFKLYGVPRSTTVLAADAPSINTTMFPITFTNRSGKASGSFASNTPGTGLCEVCHQQVLTRYNRAGASNTDSHPTTLCTGCHSHSGAFKGAGGAPGSNCLGCHNIAQGPRRAIQPDFEKTMTHAVTWATMSASDCENCHEANHQDGGLIRLKVYDAAGAVASYAQYGGAAPADSVNAACLSCHDSNGGPAFTGSLTPPNVSARWSNGATTVPYNKYKDGGAGVMPNSVPVLLKSYSPHANTTANEAKLEMNTQVGCVGRTATEGCHSAHGSNFGSGVSTLGSGLGNSQSIMLNDDGGALTSTTPEEALCWGCHVDGMDYYGDSSVDGTDWQGTWDNSPDAGLTGWYKVGSFMSSHFYASGNPGVTWATGVPSGARNPIYCSTCHNPHGIDPAVDTLPQYRVPILRGTWMTSPYKEDRAPGTTRFNTADNSGSDNYGPLPRVVSTKYQATVKPGGGYSPTTYLNANNSGFTEVGWDGYFIDQNTFGKNVYITEPATTFAGLCLTTNCHNNQATLTGAWSGHNTVKGWSADAVNDIFKGQSGVRAGNGTAQTNTGGSEWILQFFGGNIAAYSFASSGRFYGTRNSEGSNNPRTPTIDNREVWATTAFGTWGLTYATQSGGGIQSGFHQFTCSKCHTPHASRLQRLMRTNCLDNGAAVDYKATYAAQNGIALTNNHTKTGTTEWTNIVLSTGISGGAGNPGPNLMNFEAANCHSVAGSSSGGWNAITPW